MKKAKFLLFASLACLLAVACEKEDEEPARQQTFDKFVMGDTRFTSEDGTKVVLQYSANRLVYEESDIVKVNGETFTLSKTGTGAMTKWFANGPGVTASEFYCAYVDGVDGTLSNFSGNTYHFSIAGRLSEATNKVILAGVTDSNVLTLRPACAIIRVKANNSYSNVKVGFEKNKVYKEGTMTITSEGVTFSGGEFMTGVDVSGQGADFLSMEYNTTEGYWYVAVPVSTVVTTKLYFYWELGGTPTGMQTSGRVELNKGFVYTVGTTRQSPFNADGTSKCRFKVSTERGEYVRFSPGNLQAKFVSSTTWQFAPSQLESLLGPGAANTARDGVWYDLFGFGTSDWNSGEAAGYRSYYNVDDPSKYIQHSLTGTYANADWGVRNGASILYQGSPSGTSWRTLTSAEWGYLMGRTDKVAFATVDGVKGVLLLPDIDASDEEWSLPQGVSLSYAKTSYDNNTISSSVWNTLEAAGVIFLPITGYRQVTTLYGSEEGHYWSTTYDPTDPYGDNLAYVLKFTGSSISVTSADMLTSKGRAVRLVHPEF